MLVSGFENFTLLPSIHKYQTIIIVKCACNMSNLIEIKLFNKQQAINYTISTAEVKLCTY